MNEARSKPMTIYSPVSDPEEFRKIKRRGQWKWDFLVSGEWYETMYHQGNMTLYLAIDRKKGLAALMEHSFPKRIAAVVAFDAGHNDEDIASELLLARRKAGGVRVDFDLWCDGDVLDAQKCKELYWEKL